MSAGNLLYSFSTRQSTTAFPDPGSALTEPNGLLAAGGDLSVERLLSAYQLGIFPWYESDQPILWWSPEPRTVLLPDRLRKTRSLRKTLKRNPFEVTHDRAFDQVINACAQPRDAQGGTWITDEMASAYRALFQCGHAHSIECWHKDQLVGGLYGVALGSVFFGESMFSIVSNASKVALVALCDRLLSWHYQLIDCQVHSEHLERMGAIEIPRAEFMQRLRQWCAVAPAPQAWR